MCGAFPGRHPAGGLFGYCFRYCWLVIRCPPSARAKEPVLQTFGDLSAQISHYRHHCRRHSTEDGIASPKYISGCTCRVSKISSPAPLSNVLPKPFCSFVMKTKRTLPPTKVGARRPRRYFGRSQKEDRDAIDAAFKRKIGDDRFRPHGVFGRKRHRW